MSSFGLSAPQIDELHRSRRLILSLSVGAETTLTLHPEKPILTVLTVFRPVVRKSGALLRALNEANKATTVGGFVCLESGEMALKTTTFFPEGMEVPTEQITEIVRSHYSPAVEELVTSVRTVR